MDFQRRTVKTQTVSRQGCTPTSVKLLLLDSIENSSLHRCRLFPRFFLSLTHGSPIAARSLVCHCIRRSESPSQRMGPPSPAHGKLPKWPVLPPQSSLLRSILHGISHLAFKAIKSRNLFIWSNLSLHSSTGNGSRKWGTPPPSGFMMWDVGFPGRASYCFRLLIPERFGRQNTRSGCGRIERRQERDSN
jgi:hypothetical protein